MITELSVRGFKSLANLAPLELGVVNVFIGANGSGKSNLLEAVGVLGAAAAGHVDDKALLSRGVRPATPRLYNTSLQKVANVPDTVAFRVAGEWQGAEAHYDLSLASPLKNHVTAWRFTHEVVHRGTDALISRATQPDVEPHKGLAAFARGHRDLTGAPEKLLTTLSEYAIFSPNTPVLRGTATDPEQREPVGLAGGRLPEAMEEILDLAQNRLGAMDLDDVLELLDWVAGFDIVPPSRQLLSASVPALRSVIRFTDYWMNNQRNQLSGYDASEGALYVLFALTLALHPRTPPLFAIDNFDQSMHPRLARALTRQFCQQMVQAEPPRQALLTTHNPLVLDGLDLRDDRVRLFAVERDSAGATQVYRVKVSEEMLRKAREGLSLANLWVMGNLGGVPINHKAHKGH